MRNTLLRMLTAAVAIKDSDNKAAHVARATETVINQLSQKLDSFRAKLDLTLISASSPAIVYIENAIVGTVSLVFEYEVEDGLAETNKASDRFKLDGLDPARFQGVTPTTINPADIEHDIAVPGPRPTNTTNGPDNSIAQSFPEPITDDLAAFIKGIPIPVTAGSIKAPDQPRETFVASASVSRSSPNMSGIFDD